MCYKLIFSFFLDQQLEESPLSEKGNNGVF